VGDSIGLLRGDGPSLGPYATRWPDAERTLLRVLDLQSEERADHTWLVVDGVDRLTFAEARRQTHAVAHALVADDLAGEHVALFLRNHIAFMPVLLGAMAAGGVAVPLNPELRGPLLTRMLERCGARVLVADARLVDRLVELDSLAGVDLVALTGEVDGSVRDALSALGARVVDLAEWSAAAPAGTLPPYPDSSAPALLMFTSGTSGGSKAAVWSHHYLYLGGACISDSMRHTRDSVLSTPLSLCHIAGLQNFAASALHAGCTAHLKSQFSASRYWSEIAADGATFSMLMGPMAAMILAATPDAPPHRLERLYILPQPAQREEFERRYRTTVVWQGWGMTEIFPHTPAYDRLENVPADTIGPAPSWVDWGVVDEHDRLLGPGELGELVYRPLFPGGMADGYYGDAEATARAMRHFMFHTGDIGYYDEVGYMHFVMRNQDAIRRRGENVSAVELEAVALDHPRIVEAAAYAVPSPLGEHDVKLDVVLDDGPDRPDAATVHDWLRHRLPRFMIPTYLELRSTLPRTVSQRVEKYKLAAEGVDRASVYVHDDHRSAANR
jgi:crotonobetaine/carnitine-CoA ligase